MSNPQGFWSYVHADDEAEGGRISRLAQDVSSQFEMLTGESLDLFLDRDAIKWGENWRARIDSSLAGVAFFVPILTPRYFMSPECRRELQFFARQAEKLGIKDLVLPIVYIDIPALERDDDNDDLVTLVRTFQWEDWRELRFAAVTDEGYRRGVARLARRIVDANLQAETAPTAGLPTDEARREDVDEAPGFIDQMAGAEDALPKVVITLESATEQLQRITDMTAATTNEINKADRSGAAFSVRLILARKLASQLGAPTDQLISLGNDFVSQLHDVDLGVRALIERAPEAVLQNPENASNICEFFDSVRQMANSSRETKIQTQALIDNIAPGEKMSRDLRPVLRRMRQGLRSFVEGTEVTEEWLRLIDNSSVNCADTEAFIVPNG